MAAKIGSRPGACPTGLDRKLYFSQVRKNWFIRAAGLLAALVFILSTSPEPQLLQITFLGDVMLGRGVDKAAARTKNWKPFEKLYPVTGWADILVANLESPLTIAPTVTSGYVLCAPPTRVLALQAASFDLVTLANNHVRDCGESGLTQTLLTLKSYGIQPVGPQPEVIYVSSHGRKLAFLALDDVTSPLDLPAVLPIVKAAASQADPVIISIHWGSEYQSEQSMRQRVQAAALTKSGADIIIGHHPHVIQPMEIISRGDQLPPALVFYSLGNALFDQHGLADTRTGKAVTLVFGPAGSIQYSTRTFEIDPNQGIIRGLLP
jgi:gamma-polyglutamate biosynthesis protein CapA